MLKSQTIQLSDQLVTLTELPALTADRYARAALAAIDAPQHGGVVALTFEYLPQIRKLGEQSLRLLEPFVVADRQIGQWQDILTVQTAALMLHAGFIVGRPVLEVPVTMTAEGVTRGSSEDTVHFCSPSIAAVLHSGRASYRELETVLSSEDAFNILELLNVEAIREWRAHQSTRQTNP